MVESSFVFTRQALSSTTSRRPRYRSTVHFNTTKQILSRAGITCSFDILHIPVEIEDQHSYSIHYITHIPGINDLEKHLMIYGQGGIKSRL